MNDDKVVVVIGSGPTGAVAALELSRRRFPVIMLEAGKCFAGGLLVRAAGRTIFRRQPSLADQSGYIASGDPKTHWYQCFSPGGLSNQWTGAVPRFAPEDFEEGERIHEKYRWPISYTDLVPYYEQMERIVQVTSDPRDVPNLPASIPTFRRQLSKDWMSVARQANMLGHGVNVLPIADGPPWLIARRGTAFNSFTQIVRKLGAYKHFKLITGAHALTIEWRSDKKTASAVVYYDIETGVQRRIKADAVVVAAGPLSSTKLLLDSSCRDFPCGLGNSNGVLGRYLHDHAKEWWVIDFDKPLSRRGLPVYVTRAPYHMSKPLLAVQYTLGTTNTREKILSALPTRGKEIGVLVFGTMRPTESNYVQLHVQDKDKNGLPLLDIHLQYDDDVLQNMKEARVRLLEIFHRAGYSGIIRNIVPQLEPGSSVHYGGTIRMHVSPQYGMLDRWNRIHEIQNVLVVDASCFTTGVEKNPTITAMAIAARATNRLADDLLRK